MGDAVVGCSGLCMASGSIARCTFMRFLDKIIVQTNQG